jgi:hypothetical protein
VRSHYIFNSGIGWSLPHRGAGNVYHEDAQLAAIKDRQGLERLQPDEDVVVRDGAVTVRFGLPLPGVSLLELDAAP